MEMAVTAPPSDFEEPATSDLLLEVKDLATYFYVERGIVRAVDGVSFGIEFGKTLGVLGESGCGKSQTAYSIMRLIRPPGRIVQGQILLNRRTVSQGTTRDEHIDLVKLDPQGPFMRGLRGCEIAMVFQEPNSFLNPVYTIGSQIGEAIMLHQEVDKSTARERAIEMLRLVQMPDPSEAIDRYPHQISGGQKQRAIIAMALSCSPSLLIADEPTTALDVTTEAQILALMGELQRELGMSIMFITHNLGVIAKMADEVVVMYLGKVVEQADVFTLFETPKHPYTSALLRSIPKVGRRSRNRLEAIGGVVPDPLNVPSGCRFHDRCGHAIKGKCDVSQPGMTMIGTNHLVSCFLYSGEEAAQ